MRMVGKTIIWNEWGDHTAVCHHRTRRKLTGQLPVLSRCTEKLSCTRPCCLLCNLSLPLKWRCILFIYRKYFLNLSCRCILCTRGRVPDLILRPHKQALGEAVKDVLWAEIWGWGETPVSETTVARVQLCRRVLRWWLRPAEDWGAGSPPSAVSSFFRKES